MYQILQLCIISCILDIIHYTLYILYYIYDVLDTMYHIPHTINYILCSIWRILWTWPLSSIGHIFEILIRTCRCIYTNYVYNSAWLFTKHMMYHRLHTIYNVLFTLYLICIPYHIHYMQHTTHSFLCIIISNINHSINYISYIVYYILCTRY